MSEISQQQEGLAKLAQLFTTLKDKLPEFQKHKSDKNIKRDIDLLLISLKQEYKYSAQKLTF
jgi:hypothetical protein